MRQLVKIATIWRRFMKSRFTSLTLGLVAVLMISACVPTQVPPNPISDPASTALSPATQPEVTTEAPAMTIQPVATSRGPNLEATDPTSVALASGGLQLVEFFRFT
jgi:hypothetical protein